MARGLVRGMLAGASAWGGLSPQIPTVRAEQLSGQAVCAFLTSYIRVPGGRGSWKRAGLVLRGVNPDFLSATEGATSSCSFGDAAETSTEIEAAQPVGLVSCRDSRVMGEVSPKQRSQRDRRTHSVPVPSDTRVLTAPSCAALGKGRFLC